MDSRNGFFQLIFKPDGTYLRLYPPTGSGNPITYDEVNKYLSGHRLPNFDVKTLGQAIAGSRESQIDVKLFTEEILPENECVDIFVSTDRMKAIGRFYPPSTNGKLLTENDILKSLVQAKIKFGVTHDNLNTFFKNRIYCEDIILARGKKPEEGSDAMITYHFNTDNKSKPKKNEDGSVDFHQLDMISAIKQGDVLATLSPAVYGKPGTDVLGAVIMPRKVNSKILKHGKDIYLSEDGLTMYSNVNGHAVLTEDRVFVSNTFEVLADVDVSTGDIEYEGNVNVKGNVISGFTIRAKGDIIVNGVVEGATLIAGGHIILKLGIQGMSKGRMEASGNIISKFIENAEVKAGGYISTEAILHSKVSAKGEITVGGKKGFITGGVIRSATAINIKTAGSTMGTNTVLEVGIDPELLEEYRTLEKNIIRMNSDKDKIMPILETYKKKISMGNKLPPDKLEYIRLLTQKCIELNQDIKESTERYDKIWTFMNDNESGSIKVQNIIYPGVKLVISNIVYYVRNEIHYSKFIRAGADIKVVAL